MVLEVWFPPSGPVCCSFQTVPLCFPLQNVMDIISHHHSVASSQRSDGGCLAVPVREGRFGCFQQLEKWKWLTPKPWEQVINKPYIRSQSADETLNRIQGWLQLWLPGVTQLQADPEALLKPRLRSDWSWCRFERAEADVEAGDHLIRTDAVKTALLDSVCPLYLTYLWWLTKSNLIYRCVIKKVCNWRFCAVLLIFFLPPAFFIRFYNVRDTSTSKTDWNLYPENSTEFTLNSLFS